MLADQEYPPHLRPGAVIGGRYQVVRALGAGAMGVVLAVRTEDGRQLALKVLHESADSFGGSEGLLRFLREAQVASSINSPHVVPVVDSGVDPITGAPFLVMTLLDGFDLGACLERVGCLHPTLAVRIISQAARGLRAAHAANVIHRDVKPQNLFLTQSAVGDVTVKVCDFGVAKPVSAAAALTSTGSALGTPLYMAPEQLMDAKHVDGRADVWGLAMTLYEALAGRSAHDQVKSLPALAIALVHKDTPPLQDLAPWVDPALATIVHGALLRDLPSRCPDMETFARALAPFTSGTDRLHVDMLRPIPDDLRRHRAQRAELPKRWIGMAPSMPPPAVECGEGGANAPQPVVPSAPDAGAMLAFAETVAAPSALRGAEIEAARQSAAAHMAARQAAAAPIASVAPTKKSSPVLLIIVLAFVLVALGVGVGVAVWFATR